MLPSNINPDWPELNSAALNHKFPYWSTGAAFKHKYPDSPGVHTGNAFMHKSPNWPVLSGAACNYKYPDFISTF